MRTRLALRSKSKACSITKVNRQDGLSVCFLAQGKAKKMPLQFAQPVLREDAGLESIDSTKLREILVHNCKVELLVYFNG